MLLYYHTHLINYIGGHTPSVQKSPAVVPHYGPVPVQCTPVLGHHPYSHRPPHPPSSHTPSHPHPPSSHTPPRPHPPSSHTPSGPHSHSSHYSPSLNVKRIYRPPSTHPSPSRPPPILSSLPHSSSPSTSTAVVSASHSQQPHPISGPSNNNSMLVGPSHHVLVNPNSVKQPLRYYASSAGPPVERRGVVVPGRRVGGGSPVVVPGRTGERGNEGKGGKKKKVIHTVGQHVKQKVVTHVVNQVVKEQSNVALKRKLHSFAQMGEQRFKMLQNKRKVIPGETKLEPPIKGGKAKATLINKKTTPPNIKEFPSQIAGQKRKTISQENTPKQPKLSNDNIETNTIAATAMATSSIATSTVATSPTYARITIPVVGTSYCLSYDITMPPPVTATSSITQGTNSNNPCTSSNTSNTLVAPSTTSSASNSSTNSTDAPIAIETNSNNNTVMTPVNETTDNNSNAVEVSAAPSDDVSESEKEKPVNELVKPLENIITK